MNSITTGSAVRHFTYDPDGNILTDDHGGSALTTHTYAQRNGNHDSATSSSGSVSFYRTDAFGRRTLKLTGGAQGISLQRYHYDLQGHLIAESDASSGANLREYIWLGDIPVAQVEANGTVYYIHTDHLNTPQKMTNSARQIVWDKVQDPFGNTAYFMPTGVVQNIRFPGQYNDVDTGLNYNMHRDYDPTTGRYIESDPIGLKGGINTYGYVGGNPLNHIDPKGLDATLFVPSGTTPAQMAGMGYKSEYAVPTQCPSRDDIIQKLNKGSSIAALMFAGSLVTPGLEPAAPFLGGISFVLGASGELLEQDPASAAVSLAGEQAAIGIGGEGAGAGYGAGWAIIRLLLF